MKQPVTPMVHWHCYECGVTATCVLNEVSERAWADHMVDHDDPHNHGVWGWDVLQLFP